MGDPAFGAEIVQGANMILHLDPLQAVQRPDADAIDTIAKPFDAPHENPVVGDATLANAATEAARDGRCGGIVRDQDKRGTEGVFSSVPHFSSLVEEFAESREDCLPLAPSSQISSASSGMICGSSMFLLRISPSISSIIAGCSSRKVRAFSRPCPSRVSP